MEIFRNGSDDTEVVNIFNDYRTRQVVVTDGVDWLIEPMGENLVDETTIIDGYINVTQDLQPMPFFTRVNLRPSDQTDEDIEQILQMSVIGSNELAARQAIPFQARNTEEFEEGVVEIDEEPRMSALTAGIWVAATAMVNEIQDPNTGEPIHVITQDLQGYIFPPRLSTALDLPIETFQAANSQQINEAFTAALVHVNGRAFPHYDITLPEEGLEILTRAYGEELMGEEDDDISEEGRIIVD